MSSSAASDGLMADLGLFCPVLLDKYSKEVDEKGAPVILVNCGHVLRRDALSRLRESSCPCCRDFIWGNFINHLAIQYMQMFEQVESVPTLQKEKIYAIFPKDGFDLDSRRLQSHLQWAVISQKVDNLMQGSDAAFPNFDDIQKRAYASCQKMDQEFGGDGLLALELGKYVSSDTSQRDYATLSFGEEAKQPVYDKECVAALGDDLSTEGRNYPDFPQSNQHGENLSTPVAGSLNPPACHPTPFSNPAPARPRRFSCWQRFLERTAQIFEALGATLIKVGRGFQNIIQAVFSWLCCCTRFP